MKYDPAATYHAFWAIIDANYTPQERVEYRILGEMLVI